MSADQKSTGTFDCDKAKCSICGNIDHTEEDCALLMNFVSNEICMAT